MFKKLMLLSAVALSLATNAQDSKKGFYLKAGGSYFIQTVPTNFPSVDGQTATKDANIFGAKSSEAITGSFGEGYRSNLVGGYRLTERLGFEMGVHYYQSNSKTMLVRDNQGLHPLAGAYNIHAEAKGVVRALDLSPSVVLYLGEVNKFEPYTKVGVIVPVYGSLTIDFEQTSNNLLVNSNKQFKDVIKPQATLGFMSAIGTSYKITNNLSAFGEIEYRNFTVKGKSKERTVWNENGQDVLGTKNYIETHTNYVDQLNSGSNNTSYNANTNVNSAKDELGSYISISGVGLSLGMRYNF